MSPNHQPGPYDYGPSADGDANEQSVPSPVDGATEGEYRPSREGDANQQFVPDPDELEDAAVRAADFALRHSYPES